MQHRKWIVLGAFMGVAAVSQMLWLNFAPVQTLIMERYGVSEFMAGFLTFCFPLLYVFFSMPAGAMTDRRGYRFTIGWSSVLMAVGAVIRIYEASFYALLIGQLAIAVAQPYVMNGITKLATDWFPEDEQAAATGLGTAGMFIGMAAGMATSAPLTEAYGLGGAMIIFAGISVVAAAFFLLFAKENGQEMTQEQRVKTSRIAGMTAMEEFQHLIKDRSLTLIFILSFLALGFFNGLATWLEGILGENGVEPTDAGLVGGAMIIGGIVGSIIIPAISDKIQRRKPFLIFCGLAGAALAYPLCTSSNLTLLYSLGALLGVLFLPGYALLLAMSEEMAGKERAGGAAGLLMLAGNGGGVVVSLLMEALHNESWSTPILLLMAVMALIVVLAFFAPESAAAHRSELRP